MYTVRVFVRTTHEDEVGNLIPEFTQANIKPEDFTTPRRALSHASFLATHDAVVWAIGQKHDGFAVVVYCDGKPYMCIEHDGIRLNTFYGEELSDDFYEVAK